MDRDMEVQGIGFSVVYFYLWSSIFACWLLDQNGNYPSARSLLTTNPVLLESVGSYALELNGILNAIPSSSSCLYKPPRFSMFMNSYLHVSLFPFLMLAYVLQFLRAQC